MHLQFNVKWQCIRFVQANLGDTTVSKIGEDNMEKYPDGLELEQRFDQELREFKNHEERELYNIEAAILLRDSNKLETLRALQQGEIDVYGAVDLDDECTDNLVFRMR